jgi:uncharacterized Fe-S cluster-containing radical SAM superfamily protein
MFDSIYVELTSVCNMACEYCPNEGMVRARKHMDFSMFMDVIDQIADNRLTQQIQLAALGESFLYPRLLEAVNYCNQKKLGTSIITNGLLLTPDLYQKLVDSGLKELQISFHDLNEDSFAYRHAKTNIEYTSFFKNIFGIVDYHVSHNLPMRLVIHLMFCKERWISSELWDLPKIKNNTKNAPALLQPLIDELGRISEKNSVKSHLSKNALAFALRSLDILKYRNIKIMQNVSLNIVSLNPQLYNTRIRLGGPLGERIKLVARKKGSCPFLGSPMILSNGSFVPCCIDGLEELLMGKIDSQTSLASIISNDKYQSLINGFKRSNIVNPTCQECRGRLIYKDPLLQRRYLISSFNLYELAANLMQESKQLLWKFWWRNLSDERKNKIKTLLRKSEVALCTRK